MAAQGEAPSKRIKFHWNRRFLAGMADRADVMRGDSMLVFASVSLVSACCPESASVLRGPCPAIPLV